jgi:hypothetical protein
MPIARHFERGFGKRKVALAVAAIEGGEQICSETPYFPVVLSDISGAERKPTQTHRVYRN